MHAAVDLQSLQVLIIKLHNFMNNYVVSTRHNKEVPIHYTTTTVILHAQVDIHMYSRYAHVE